MSGNTDAARGEMIGIWLTNACNLRCSYCYIPVKSDLTIDFDMAVGIIRSQLKKPGGMLEVCFMGAEPLARFDLMRRIVDTIRADDHQRPVHFMAATNGTLLTEEMKPWLIENRDILSLGLSYDGGEDTQDINRSGSSSMIDREFFLTYWPGQLWKMTISRDNAANVDRDIIALHEQGARFTANAAYEAEVWPEETIAAYELALYRLAEYYAEHPEVVPCNMMYSRLEAVICPDDVRQPCYCSAGESFSFFDMQGQAYPCHLVSPLVMHDGNVIKGQFFPENTDFQDPRCAQCLLRGSCYTCLGTNFAYRGDIRLRDPMHCRLYQAQIRASIHMMLLKMKKKTRYTRTDVANAAAIRKLLTAFDEGRIGMKQGGEQA